MIELKTYWKNIVIGMENTQELWLLNSFKDALEYEY